MVDSVFLLLFTKLSRSVTLFPLCLTWRLTALHIVSGHLPCGIFHIGNIGIYLRTGATWKKNNS